MSSGAKERDWKRTIGTLLVIIGVTVWVVYAIERYFLSMDVHPWQFLPYHLAGVIPGSLLRHHRFFKRLLKKSFK
jgi:hypothetical protein